MSSFERRPSPLSSCCPLSPFTPCSLEAPGSGPASWLRAQDYPGGHARRGRGRPKGSKSSAWYNGKAPTAATALASSPVPWNSCQFGTNILFWKTRFFSACCRLSSNHASNVGCGMWETRHAWCAAETYEFKGDLEETRETQPELSNGGSIICVYNPKICTNTLCHSSIAMHWYIFTCGSRSTRGYFQLPNVNRKLSPSSVKEFQQSNRVIFYYQT